MRTLKIVRVILSGECRNNLEMEIAEKTRKRESRKPVHTDSQGAILLGSITTAKRTITSAKGTRIFSQGEKSAAVYFI